MTDTEISALAERIFRNEVFTSAWHCRDAQQVMDSFMVIFALMENDDRKKLAKTLEDGGMVWEAFSEAGPRSVNGMPSFFSCHIVDAADTAKVREVLARMDAAMKAAKAPSAT